MQRTKAVLLLGLLSGMTASGQTPPSPPSWEWAGWGGGGFYYAVAFHPGRNGVIYLGGDVAGMYRSDDHGRHWRLINDGLADYGVFSLAVDTMSPDTVYAATPAGLCKSTNGGEQWRLLPRTGAPEDTAVILMTLQTPPEAILNSGLEEIILVFEG